MTMVTTSIQEGRFTHTDAQHSVSLPYVGNGIFTTTITERNDSTSQNSAIRIRALDFHLERLLRSAQTRFQFTSEHLANHPEHSPFWLRQELLHLVRDFHEREKAQCCKLRILIDENAVTVLQEPWSPRWDSKQGIHLKSVHVIRPSPEIKNADTAVCTSAESEARKHGADEALLISPENNVTEGSWSNFFWFNTEGELFTPQTLLLRGVTRRIILLHEPCSVRDISLEEILDTAAEAFVTQATHGIVPVVAIDDRTIGSGAPAERTKQIMARFSDFRQQYDTLVPLGE